MKTSVLFTTLFFAALTLGAQTLPDTRTSRTMVQFGGLVTRGDDTGWDQLGGGLSFRSFTYLDPASPDGLYIGFLSGALARSAGGISLADTRLVTLGWRGNPLAWAGQTSFPLQLDASLSPTVGARIQGSTVLGGAYTGVGLTLGIAFPLLEGQDLGLSWEPVFPVVSWDGSEAPNRGYSDFVVSWTMKMLTETRTLPWSGQPSVTR